jgi:hypothetical protein
MGSNENKLWKTPFFTLLRLLLSILRLSNSLYEGTPHSTSCGLIVLGMHVVLLGKPEGKRPLATRDVYWGKKIKIVLKEMEQGGMDWINLAQDWDQWLVL